MIYDFSFFFLWYLSIKLAILTFGKCSQSVNENMLTKNFWPANECTGWVFKTLFVSSWFRQIRQVLRHWHIWWILVVQFLLIREISAKNYPNSVFSSINRWQHLLWSQFGTPKCTRTRYELQQCHSKVLSLASLDERLLIDPPLLA